jgi:hypothetical protein
MSPILSHLLILGGVVVLVLVGLFTVHRKGKPFTGLRYAGIFGFVGAAFGVIIGMTTFFASQHYANVRQAAEREASAAGEFAVLSGAFPQREGAQIRAQLYCYATDVITDEWPRNTDRGSPAVEGRQRALYVLMLQVGRENVKPSSWYSSALSSALTLGEQREERLFQTAPQIPIPLWILLYAGAALVVVFAFFFHLEGRGQLFGMTGAVILMLTAVVLVLAGLDSPTEGPFGQTPHAMDAVRAGLATQVHVAPKHAKAFCAKLPVPRNEPTTLQ